MGGLMLYGFPNKSMIDVLGQFSTFLHTQICITLTQTLLNLWKQLSHSKKP